MVETNLGANIKTLRTRAGMTQDELAEAMNVHMQTVSKWERGVSQPDISQLGALSDALGVALEELVGEPVSGERLSGAFDPAAFGKNLAALRHAKNEGQRALADELFVSPDAVSKWERGIVCPDVQKLRALAAHFGVSFSQLYYAVKTEPIDAPVAAAPARKRHMIWPIAIAALVAVVAVALIIFFAVRPGKAPDPPSHGAVDVDPPVIDPVPPLHEHAYSVVSVVDPTCSAEGYSLYKCECGASYRGDIVDPLPHTIQTLAAVPATCTSTGLTEGSRCTVCRKIFVFQHEVPHYGHSFVGNECTRCHTVITPTDSGYFNFELLEDGSYGISPKNMNDLPEEVILPIEHLGAPVTRVFAYSFFNCKTVKSVIICDNIRIIDSGAFDCMENFCALYYHGSLSGWLNIDIGNYNFNTVHDMYIGGVLLTDLVIPDGVTEVRTGYFSHCKSIKTLRFSDTVTRIGHHAFEVCNSLTAVYIPFSVLYIGDCAMPDAGPVVFCEAPAPLLSWDNNWNMFDLKVVWNYVLS